MSRKIIVHWTAGTYKPNQIDLEHYHYLIDGQGSVICGRYSVEDNDNCRDGCYAQHCGGGNTRAIGIAMCGMLGFKNKSHIGQYPLRAIQVSKMCKLVAELCLKYNITVSEDTVMTHYEFGQKHQKTTSASKIDIIYLPSHPYIQSQNVGDFIRTQVNQILIATKKLI